jgi:hypothetical protein
MKRYLSGIDWIVNALDYSSRKKSGVGNISQIVLELDGRLNEEDLRSRLYACQQAIPALNGYPARAINLCPYWKNDSRSFRLSLNKYYLEDKCDLSAVSKIFQDCLDKPFSNKREHLVFNLVYYSGKSFLGMVFDHRLMDARGAEAFLNMLAGEVKFFNPLNSAQGPSNLNGWLNKLRAGKKINRVFLGLTARKPKVLPQPSSGEKSKISIFTFDAMQSAAISEDALKNAGYLMFMPYLLAKSVVCLHSIFENKKVVSGDYLLPVSVDKRPALLVHKEPFFNHLSFFLFRIDNRDAGSFNIVLADIKKQLYEQVKIGLPESIKEASFLMRIAPLPVVDFFVRLMSKGENASFAFSFVGESVFNADFFCGIKVNNLLHFPRVPAPPGLGIFFSQFRGRLNVTFSHCAGLLSEDEVKKVSSCLKELI